MTVAEIMGEFGPKNIISELLGPNSVTITGISSVENCQTGDLVFADKKEYLPLIESRRPAAVITTTAFREPLSRFKDLAVLVAPNFGLAHALIKNKYTPRDFTQSGWSGIHSSAVVHETAKVHPTVVVDDGNAPTRT